MVNYDYPVYDDKKNIICQICGKGFLQITNVHLKSHNLTTAEYKLRFPDIPLISPKRKFYSPIKKKQELFVTKKEIPLNLISDDKRDKKKVIKKDIPEHDVNPVIHKEIVFDSPNVVEVKKQVDICGYHKDRILNYLKTFFTHIEKDYMIQEYALSGHLIYECISDFADPVLKINIEFPNTFWHNDLSTNRSFRTNRLKEYGWNIIEIKTSSPTLKKIEQILMADNIYK